MLLQPNGFIRLKYLSSIIEINWCILSKENNLHMYIWLMKLSNFDYISQVEKYWNHRDIFKFLSKIFITLFELFRKNDSIRVLCLKLSKWLLFRLIICLWIIFKYLLIYHVKVFWWNTIYCIPFLSSSLVVVHIVIHLVIRNLVLILSALFQLKHYLIFLEVHIALGIPSVVCHCHSPFDAKYAHGLDLLFSITLK